MYNFVKEQTKNSFILKMILLDGFKGEFLPEKRQDHFK